MYHGDAPGTPPFATVFINLTSRVDRRVHIEEQLLRAGLDATTEAAGKTTLERSRRDLGTPISTPSSHKTVGHPRVAMSPGGCRMSHLCAWQRIASCSTRPLLVPKTTRCSPTSLCRSCPRASRRCTRRGVSWAGHRALLLRGRRQVAHPHHYRRPTSAFARPPTSGKRSVIQRAVARVGAPSIAC